MSAPRRLLSNLLVLGISCALCLLVLELWARHVRASRGGGKEAQEDQVYTEYDPLLGWRKRPGARVLYKRREYETELIVNSLGLRDPERGYAAPPGTCRVLGVGDSFLEGYTVPLGETVTQQLERRLSAGQATQVINGGTLAYSTDQELLFYRGEGLRYDPRLVLVFFYYNDVVYNDRQDYFGRPKPAFEQHGDEIVLHRYPVRQLDPAQGPRAGAAAAAAEPVAEGSALRELLGEVLWARAPRLYDRLAGLHLFPRHQQRSARLELRVYERRRVPEIDEAWAKTAAILRAFERETRKNGARLLIVYVPSRMEVQDESWEATRLLYGMTDEGWSRGLVAERLSALGVRDGYPVLDLTSKLRDADRERRGRPYFETDGHWTALGHAAAADAIAEVVSRDGLLVGCAR